MLTDFDFNSAPLEARATRQRLLARSPFSPNAPRRELRMSKAMRNGKSKPVPFVKRRRGGCPVRCIQTGVIFPSAAAASLSVGRSATAVSVAIGKYRLGERELPSAGGFTWEYVQTIDGMEGDAK